MTIGKVTKKDPRSFGRNYKFAKRNTDNLTLKDFADLIEFMSDPNERANNGGGGNQSAPTRQDNRPVLGLGHFLTQRSQASRSNTQASRPNTQASRANTQTSGTNTQASGAKTQASGTNIQASGANTQASGVNTQASGGNTQATRLNNPVPRLNNPAQRLNNQASRLNNQPPAPPAPRQRTTITYKRNELNAPTDPEKKKDEPARKMVPLQPPSSRVTVKFVEK